MNLLLEHDLEGPIPGTLRAYGGIASDEWEVGALQHPASPVVDRVTVSFGDGEAEVNLSEQAMERVIELIRENCDG